MSSKWSFGLVECSFVNLAEKILNKDQYFCDQCPKMMGKNFWQKIFQHKLVYSTNRKQYWQRDRQTSVEMTEKCCSMPDDEKEEKLSKKFCKTSPWTRGKQLWQIFRLFFDEKKADDSLFKFGRTWKKHKQKFCQNKVMSTNWSSGLVECSFVKLTGNV